MEIKTGDILLVSSDGFLPKAIQEFQGNEYNHAGVFVILNDTTYVCEALIHGIALTKWSDYLQTDKGLMVLKPKDRLGVEEENKLINFMLPYIGNTPYEFSNLLIYQAIRYISKKLFNRYIWIGRKKSKASKRFICGEWVAFLWNHIRGYFLDWNKLAPVDLYNSNNYNHVKIQ